jgi:hypothetical protein
MVPTSTNDGAADPATEAGMTASTTKVDDADHRNRTRKQGELKVELENSTKAKKTDVLGNTTHVAQGVAGIILKRLLSEECSEEQASEAMESLAEMVSSSNDKFDDHRQTALQLGAPLAIVQAMRRQTTATNFIESNSTTLTLSAKLQKDACATLAALCFHKLHDTRRHIIEIGGLDSCLEALQRFPDDVEVQVAGCNLIGSLWLRPDVRKQVVDQGGLQAVLQAMARHKKAELVQSVGCKALFTLLRLESSSTVSGGCCSWDKKAVDDGCIRAVIAAMANHLGVADLQIAACQFLIILARRSDVYRNEIIQAKGLVAAGEARRIHKDNARVVCVARNAISAIIA